MSPAPTTGLGPGPASAQGNRELARRRPLGLLRAQALRAREALLTSEQEVETGVTCSVQTGGCFACLPAAAEAACPPRSLAPAPP